jgi:hypothetical protein
MTRLFSHLRQRLRHPRLLRVLRPPHKQALQGALFARRVVVLYLNPVGQIPTPTPSSIGATHNVGINGASATITALALALFAADSIVITALLNNKLLLMTLAARSMLLPHLNEPRLLHSVLQPVSLLSEASALTCLSLQLQLRSMLSSLQHYWVLCSCLSMSATYSSYSPDHVRYRMDGYIYLIASYRAPYPTCFFHLPECKF